MIILVAYLMHKIPYGQLSVFVHLLVHALANRTTFQYNLLMNIFVFFFSITTKNQKNHRIDVLYRVGVFFL